MTWVPGRLKRNQALFQELLRQADRFGEGGVFVDPAALAGAGWRKYAGPNWRIIGAAEQAGGVRVQRAQISNTLWDWHLGAVRREWARRNTAWLREEVLGGRPFTLWVNSGGRLQAALAAELRRDAAEMICDWSDDFWTGGFGMRVEDLDRLTEMADRVVTVNEAVAERVKHGRVVVCGNGTNPEAFAGRDEGFVLPPILPKPAGTVYVGFTGGLNMQRADRALLERVFRAFPKWRFVFVGYTDTPAMRSWVESFANTVFVDEVPYSDLRHVIGSFDVAMVPHLDNEHTKGNDLLKVLDYLACGVPVVSTDSSGVRRYGAAVRVASDHGEFEQMLRLSVAGRNGHDPGPGLQVVRRRSWGAVARRLAEDLGWATCVSHPGS